MGCCKFILKIGFIAFFALNGWNTLQNIGHHTTTFGNSYKNFVATFVARTGFQVPPQLGHAEISKHSEAIVKGLAWAQVGLSGAAVLICGGFAQLAGLIYFIQQVIHLNIASYTSKTSFEEFERFALALGLLVASFVVGACTKNQRLVAKFTSGSADSNQKANQAKDKKKN